MKTEDIKKMGLAYLSVLEANKKVEDASNDKSDDGDGLDKVDPKASKKKFKDRKDKDVDNDGDTDASDEYLHKKRKAIGKDMAKDAKAEANDEDDAEEEEDPKAKKDKPKKGVNPFEARAAKIKEAAAVKKALKASDEEDEADDAGEEGDDEKEIMANKKKLKASNKFIGALQAAKKNGDDTFVVSGKKFTVKEEEGDDEPEADDEEDIQAAKKKALKASKAVEKGMKDDAKKEDVDYNAMSDEDFDAMLETASMEQLEGVFSAIGGAAKAVAGGVKKVANRLSTSGRADAADNKLAKVKKKMADKERLKKAKDGIAALKKKPAPTNEEEEADAGPAKDKDQVCEECGKVHEGDCDPADLKPTVAKEEVTIEKAYSGVQSGMRQAMMQMWEKAAEQDLVDTKGRNDFVAKHKGEVQGDAQKIADETAKVIAGSGKTSPKNKGDK
jgi:hypothetical protein